MKLTANKNKYNKGFISTIELMIALALGVIFITGSSMVLHNAQTAGLDAGLTNSGLYKIETNVEDAVATTTANWNSTMGVLPNDAFYNIKNVIKNISPCVKEVSGNIGWTSEKERALGARLVTYVTNVEEIKKLGGCDPFPPPSDWDTPTAYNFPSGIIHSGSDGTGVDVVWQSGKRLTLLTTTKSSGGGSGVIKDTLWIVDTTNSNNPTYLGSHSGDDKNLLGISTIPNYAFVISASTTAPFQVIDISNPNFPNLVAKHLLPEVSTDDIRSIFYYNKKVYIGTKYLACLYCSPSQNNELHIFDVSSPTNPNWEASINVDRNVHGIIVRDGLLFLATGHASVKNPLKIYDLKPLTSSGAPNPTYLKQIGSFTATATNNQAGTALYLLGNSLFLGLERATGSNKDFYILDVTDPTLPKEYTGGSSIKLNLSNNAYVKSIMTQGKYAFLGIYGTNPGDTFQVFDVSNVGLPKRINTCTSGNPFPQNATGIVYSDNLIFVSFRSNDALRIVYDTPSICTS